MNFPLPTINNWLYLSGRGHKTLVRVNEKSNIIFFPYIENENIIPSLGIFLQG